jgi:signal transduction histidine kinase
MDDVIGTNDRPGRALLDASGDKPPRGSGDWYWETDAEGILTSVSRSLELFVGARPGACVGKPLGAIGTLLRGDTGEVPMQTAMARASSFRDQLMVVRSKTGATRLYRLAGIVVWDKETGSSGYRGVATVLPGSGRLLEQMRAELGRSAQRQFLSAMSHELRTPLNAIIGFAEAMSGELHGPLKPKYVDYAGDIASAGRHLLGLIKDLLDISSLDSGSVDLHYETFDVSPLVAQARAMVSMKANARSIDLRAVEIDYPVKVRADRRRTLQILVNLLGNAVKFTPEGGAVGCELATREGPEEVSITVWDTGPGIAPEDHARVFEKFEQLPNQSPYGTGDGSGLGLHISRRLATLMGGSLTLASELGSGARFTLTLPSAD